MAAVTAERVDQQTRAALSLDAHPERGHRIFERDCAGCHGAKGLGNVKRRVPALAGQRYAYLIRQLANFSGDERDSSAMHGVLSKAGLDNPQTWVDMAAYLNGIADEPRLLTGPGRDLALGQHLFQAQCAACHSVDASGDADGFTPSLRHQLYGYLSAQMHKLAGGYRHNLDESLMSFLDQMDDRDIGATADYLSRLAGPGKLRKRMRDDGVVVD